MTRKVFACAELLSCSDTDMKAWSSKHAAKERLNQDCHHGLPDSIVSQLGSVNDKGVWLLDGLPGEATAQLCSIAKQECAG